MRLLAVLLGLCGGLRGMVPNSTSEDQAGGRNDSVAGAVVPTYRNEAAHVGEVDKGMAEGCRDEVRGIVLVMVNNEKNG